MNDTYVLQMEGIEKEYSGVKVLRGIDLQVRPGEVVSIVGENGAGKSTLMNILFGMPVIHSTGGFKGSVRLCGEEVRITSPEKAIEFGIGMVHQEFMLLPNFTVAENIKINRENTRPNPLSRIFGRQLQTLDVSQNNADARVALDKMGMQSLDERTAVEGMPVGYMQFIECAREIDKKNIKLIGLRRADGCFDRGRSEATAGSHFRYRSCRRRHYFHQPQARRGHLHFRSYRCYARRRVGFYA